MLNYLFLVLVGFLISTIKSGKYHQVNCQSWNLLEIYLDNMLLRVT